jgi:CRP-like cAMP-binding protein
MDRAVVASIPLFGRLSPEEQERVAAAARTIHFEAGEPIVYEGEFSFDFYALTNGAAEVRHGDEHVADLHAGDVVGEMGVVRPESGRWTRRRGATVVATAPTDAIEIAGDDFRGLTEAIPALAGALHDLSSERAPAEP